MAMAIVTIPQGADAKIGGPSLATRVDAAGPFGRFSRRGPSRRRGRRFMIAT